MTTFGSIGSFTFGSTGYIHQGDAVQRFIQHELGTSAEGVNMNGLDTAEKGRKGKQNQWSKSEVVSSIVMFIQVFGWGLFIGILGATLLDLEEITKTTTAQVSLFFAAFTLGAILGAPVGGILLDRISRYIYMFMCVTAFGIILIFIPYADSFIKMIIIAIILGIFMGIQDVGQNIIALLVWGWKRSIVMQAFHGTFALATAVAPWLAKPFLSAKRPAPVKQLPENYTLGDSLQDNTTIKLSENTMVLPENTTMMLDDYDNSTMISDDWKFETKIHIIYLVVGIYVIISAFLYLFAYYVNKKETAKHDKIYKPMKAINSNGTEQHNTSMETKSVESDMSKKEADELWYKVTIVFLTFLRFAFVVGLEVIYGGLIMTFCVKGLDWSKPAGLTATMVFRTSFAIGRGLGIVLAMFMTPTKMVFLDLFLLVVAFVVLCISQLPTIIWVTSGMVGLGVSSLYAASMSWAQRYIFVTGKIGSFFCLGSQVGVLLFPYLAGYLFDNYSHMGFVYVCSAMTVALCITVCISTALGTYYKRRKREKMIST